MTANAGGAFSASTNLNNLLDLARDNSKAGRATLVDAVGDLLINNSGDVSEREAALMSEILGKLIRDVEASVRKALAERLADRDDVPSSLIVMLAKDEASVAHPVLLDSPLLDDPELLDIISTRTREHQLSVANRGGISETVTDALIATGDGGVIKALLENAGARISQLALEYLVEQARRTDEYHEPLVSRDELPSDLAIRLYWWVSAALRARITDMFDVDPLTIDETLQSAVRDMIAETDTGGGAQAEKASELVEHLARTNAIDSKLLIQVLREGEIPLFEAMYAKIAGLPPELVKSLLYQQGGEQLAITSKAARISKPDFASIFLLSRQGRPGDHSVDPEELSNVLAMFDRLELETAEETVRSWRRNPKSLSGEAAQKSTAREWRADAASAGSKRARLQ